MATCNTHAQQPPLADGSVHVQLNSALPFLRAPCLVLLGLQLLESCLQRPRLSLLTVLNGLVLLQHTQGWARMCAGTLENGVSACMQASKHTCVRGHA